MNRLFLCLCSVAPDGDDVRLVRGASRCAGILEKKHEEDWKPVDDQLSAWNLTSAAAVCRKLDCGSVVSLQRRVTLPDTPPDFLIHGFIHGVSRSTSLEISCSGQWLLSPKKSLYVTGNVRDLRPIRCIWLYKGCYFTTYYFDLSTCYSLLCRRYPVIPFQN